VGLALRRRGASAGSAVAFWLANPTLNLAVLAWITFALGWQWAAIRGIVGLALVAGAAVVVSRLVPSFAGDPDIAATSREESGPWALRWLTTVVRLTLLLVPVLIVLTLILGAVRAYLFPAITPEWANNPLVILGFAVAGMTFPIPTGAEIPIIQTMRSYGLGAGPAGALLLTLAPLNLPSLAMVSHGFPPRALAALAGLTALAGVVAGGLAMAFGL